MPFLPYLFKAYAIAMEEISRGCASTGVIMSVNNVSTSCHDTSVCHLLSWYCCCFLLFITIFYFVSALSSFSVVSVIELILPHRGRRKCACIASLLANNTVGYPSTSYVPYPHVQAPKQASTRGGRSSLLRLSMAPNHPFPPAALNYPETVRPHRCTAPHRTAATKTKSVSVLRPAREVRNPGAKGGAPCSLRLGLLSRVLRSLGARQRKRRR